MTIFVREEALLRNAVRYGDPVVRKSGADMVIHLTQALFNADGVHYGNAFIEVRGRRTFGRLVAFGRGIAFNVTTRADDPATGKAVRISEADEVYLHETAVYMVEELAKLCRCGKLPAHCDCCPVCLGSGFSRLTPRLSDCDPCGGKGYTDAPEAGKEPSEAS